MLKLKINPTFKATVEIPAPGGPMPVEFEFKHMTRAQFDRFLDDEKKKTRSDEEAINEIVCGWGESDTPFSPEAVTELVQKYHASARVIFNAYIGELTQAKLGN